MSATADSFNRSSFGRWINSPAGRVFRGTAGTGFVVAGLAHQRSAWRAIAGQRLPRIDRLTLGSRRTVLPPVARSIVLLHGDRPSPQHSSESISGAGQEGI